MSRRAASVLLVLLLAAAGCDAPKVISRQAPKDDNLIDTGAAPQVPSGNADLLQKVDAMKARLAKMHKPVAILLALGNLYYDNDRWPDAIDAYRQAIEKAEPAIKAREALVARKVRPAKTPPDACTGRDDGDFTKGVAEAEALAKRGRRGEALACYDATLNPIATALARRGAAWSMLDRESAAQADLDQALKLQPRRPEILYLLGAVIFQNLGAQPDPAQVKAGQKAWEQFLKVAPSNPRAPQVRQALAQVKQMLAQQSGAAQPAAAAPAAGGAPAGGGAPMAGGGAPPMAGGGAPMAGGGGGGMPPVLAMAEQQLDSGNAQAALGICNQFLQVATGFPAALVMKARALMALGRGTEAGPLLDQALQKDQSGRTLAAMAEYQATVNKDVAKARADYQKAIAADPAYAKQAGLKKKLAALK